ncbi:discoidin domain-containing protein [Lederbergia citrisecunda]|uniref:discoidin domain-containing protein n=1 Tax=Lederbergia citrisecunda TaxID=2833583 RepID=UPI003D2E9666
MPENFSCKTLISLGDGYKKYVSKENLRYYDILPVFDGENTKEGISVTASSFASIGAVPTVWRAFDDKLETIWSNNSNSVNFPIWVKISLPAKKRVRRYELTMNSGLIDNLRTPKSWTFEGSNDGNAWTVLDVKENVSDWVEGKPKSYLLNSTDEYLFYRVNITENNGANIGTVIGISEFKIFEVRDEIDGWKTVSPTLPTLTQFQEEGMDDLSILDRKVQQVLGSPQQMTSEALGEGKVFKGSVDLKKLFDLRKLEVR